MFVSVVNVGFGLPTVKVSEVDWPIRMLAAPNALLSVGGEGNGTLSDADAVPPAPLWVDVMLPVSVVLGAALTSRRRRSSTCTMLPARD